MNCPLRKVFCAVALLIGMSAVPALAAVLIPPELEGDEGAQYQLVFVTDGARDATSSNIADYNDFVQSQAEALGSITENYGITWKAIASTPTKAANQNAEWGNVNVYLLNGEQRVADPLFHKLWGDGPFQLLETSINVTQFGGVVSNTSVWTGSLSYSDPDLAGRIDPDYALGVSDDNPDTADLARFGWNNIFPSWIQSETAVQTDEFPLYALSEVLTVPSDNVIPEPSTSTLRRL